MDRTRSTQLFAEAQQLMPGGVSSPVRAFGAVTGEPPLIARGKGSRIWDEDGNSYIDYVGSWGPAILGHANEEVIAAACEAASKGLSFGAPTHGESLLARELIAAIPSMEKVRFVSSGTEACMSAIRLARGFTGKKLVVKFSGHYHGHSDGLLAKAGSGIATLSLPSCAGVPAEIVELTLVCEFNHRDELERIFDQYRGQIAAVIVEAIGGNAGFIRAEAGFLELIRSLCTSENALFILDEVMTGFRVGYGGWQNKLKITPDLTTLAKVIGGGMPLAAFGGRKDVMDHLAPLGPVYQAGTLSGNPVATACGLATLRQLQRPGVYEELSQKAAFLVNGLQALAHRYDIPFTGDYEGGMFGYFFSHERVKSYTEAQKTAVHLFPRFFHLMLEKGIYLAPSMFEASFISLAHSQEDLQATLDAAEEVFSVLLREAPGVNESTR